jgi:hypothetical protein
MRPCKDCLNHAAWSIVASPAPGLIASALGFVLSGFTVDSSCVSAVAELSDEGALGDGLSTPAALSIALGDALALVLERVSGRSSGLYIPL